MLWDLAAEARPPLFGPPASGRPTTPPKRQSRAKARVDLEVHETQFKVGRTPSRGESVPRDAATRCPTAVELQTRGFGRPNKDHSAVQEACAETTIFLVLKSGFLSKQEVDTVRRTGPLADHLIRTAHTLRNYDFRWLRDPDTRWASQSETPAESKRTMLACLFHYNLDVSLMMRYLGGNYAGAHRDAAGTAKILQQHGVSEDLIRQYQRVMTVGCPRVFNTTITRENALKYY